MPRVKMAAEKYATEDLTRLLRFYLSDVTHHEIADAMGIADRTLQYRLAQPEKLKLWEIRKFVRALNLTEAEKNRLRKLAIP